MDIKKLLSEMKMEVEINPAVAHKDPFRVLISTVLSARTKDKNTVKATKMLFSKYKTPREIAVASEREIQDLIKPSGFYRIKAERIIKISKKILEEFEGKTPDNLEDLLKLPGVGRKTANCVLVYGFSKNAIPVDTHVHRISNRIGLVDTEKPEETEEELKKIVPKKFWVELNDLFVKYGQKICLPRNPKCNVCRVRDYCKFWKFSSSSKTL